MSDAKDKNYDDLIMASIKTPGLYGSRYRLSSHDSFPENEGPWLDLMLLIPNELYQEFKEERMRLKESDASADAYARSNKAMLRRCVEFLLSKQEKG